MRAQASDEAEKEVNSGPPPSSAPPTTPPPSTGKAVVRVEVDRLIEGGTELSDGRVKGAWPERFIICDCAPGPKSSCCGWRSTLKDAMLSTLAANISTGLVVFNLVIMCMPYAGQPDSWGALCEGLGSFVTWGAAPAK